MRSSYSIFVISALGVLASPAYAQDHNAGGMHIAVTIPESCYMQAENISIAPGDGSVATTITETCNSTRGFRVTASHRPLLTDERVEVIYAGNAVALAPSGISDITFRNGPSFGRFAVKVHADALYSGLAISFGMTAI